MKNEKLRQALDHFVIPHVNNPIKFKFGGDELFKDLIQKIGNNSDIEFNFDNLTLNMFGTSLKPKGHYGETLDLKKYYMAFTWLSGFNVEIDRTKNIEQQLAPIFQLYNIVAKIAENNIINIDEFQNQINTIFGKPTTYTISSFVNDIPKLESLDESLSWILANIKYFQPYCKTDSTIKLITNYFNDKLPFNLFGECIKLDHTIISKLVDDKLVTENSNILLRKFPLTYDLIYTLFGNKYIKEDITRLMTNIENLQRDGYIYDTHLEQLAIECEFYMFPETIYDQELKMIRSLAQDKLSIFPFNTNFWGKKQAVAQIAHYVEVRHDNCLYIKKTCGFMQCCEYPDLLVEPVPLFWTEMLALVNMFQKIEISTDKWESANHKRTLDSFAKALNMFIEYSNLYLDSKPIEDKIVKKLKSIIVEHHSSGGDLYYEGWYSNLFHDIKKELKPNPEISSYFTGLNDERGPGGHLHIGTGPCKLMYILINDPITKEEKIMLGPTYSAYEFITDFDTELSDEEWAKVYMNYKSI